MVGDNTLADLLRTLRARFVGRQGLLVPPPGGGRLVWIKAGASRDSVLLAVELARAVRERRKDVRLALTFDRDYPELLRPRVRGIAGLGLGYGPGDRPSALRRAFRRLTPLGIVLTEEAPSARLLDTLEQQRLPVLRAFGSPARADDRPTPPNGGSQASAPAGDLLTLVTEAQIDPAFRAALCPDGVLWWLQSEDPAYARQVIRRWCLSPLAKRGVLLVGAGRPSPVLGGLVPLSGWRRNPHPTGTVLGVDEARWLPAVAVSSEGIALDGPERFVQWQALAAGSSVSVRRPSPVGPLDVVATPEAVIARWEQEQREPLTRRARGDLGRKLFWSERRRAASAVVVLLDRIYAW